MSDKNKQEAFWRGEQGDEYLRRNRVDWRARIPFWDMIIQKYGIRSVFEMGTNAGWNFSAIKHSISGYNVGCEGCEINSTARLQAEVAGHRRINESLYSGPYGYHEMQDPPANGNRIWYKPANSVYEMTFTSGVLIHIAPAELEDTMQKLVDISCDYVMAIEYEAEQEEHVTYRGQDGYLWKRPYGQLYQDMGLELIETGKAEGFDDCQFWILRK